MKWEKLLSTERARETSGNKYKSTDLRSEFEKDYHRIIGSASFRRLQDKTQVFPLDKSDFIRTRLTHSLEVASLGKSLGQNIGQNILSQKKDPDFTPQMKEDICHIVECAGLIHDIGNPPFGHYGETAIREWFTENLPKLRFQDRFVEELFTDQMKGDFYHFEGNAQALRLVSKLHYLVDEHGMNLTYGLLNTIVKYPGSSLAIDVTSGNIKDKKMGYYYAEEQLFQRIQKSTGAGHNRHPLTYILEAADDLAYKTADIEDAFVKGFISYNTLIGELRGLRDRNPEADFDALMKLEQQYERGVGKRADNPEEYAVKNWIVRLQGYLISCATEGFTRHYDEIMAGTFTKDLFYDTFGQQLMDLLGDMAFRYVFSSSAIYRMELTEGTMIDFLMSKFIRAAINYDTDTKLDSTDTRMISLISDNYKKAYHFQAVGKSEGEKLYLRMLLVTDYICGMTDSYAKRLYQELQGIL